MNKQLDTDIKNKAQGLANPAWHFLNDPTQATDMQAFLKKLQDGNIPWEFGDTKNGLGF